MNPNEFSELRSFFNEKEQIIAIGNCTLKVEKMDDKRIDSVRITIHPIKKDNPDEQEQ